MSGAFFVFFRVQYCLDFQSLGGGRRGDVVEYGFVAFQRNAGPVFADFAEQPVFGGIPLRGARGIMAGNHRQPMAIGEFALQVAFPDPGAGAVAAAAIGQQQQRFGVGVVPAAFQDPPAFERVGGSDRYLLSNNHVIADTNAAPMGSRIVQPGTLEGGVTPRDDIALLAAFQRIDFAGANHIDAAIGALPDPAAVDPAILGPGVPANPPAPAAVGQSVRKHGRTTAITTGTVVDTSFDGFVDYGPAGLAWFEDQIVVVARNGPFSQPGDSGSLVVVDAGHPVALLSADDDVHTLANPIDLVLAAFGVTVAT